METSGTIKFIVAGEAYHTWYKTFGDFKRIGHRPLVALHGGPEVSHHYMLYVQGVPITETFSF